MIYFPVFEAAFPKLYKWLMQVYKPNMEGFTNQEGCPYFYIDPVGCIYFNRDSYKLPENIRHQTLDLKAQIEIKLDNCDAHVSIITSEKCLYLSLKVNER